MTDRLTESVRTLIGSAETLLASRVLHDGAGRDPLLTRAVDVVAAAENLMKAAVQQARDDGATWQVIGDSLGVSRQAAFQRFGRSIDPRTGDTMNTTPLENAAAIAAAIVRDLEAARWSLVIERFDPAMRERLSEDALAAAWAQIVGMSGALQSHGEPVVSRAADLTVTDTSLAMEAGDYTARISFRDDQTIAGLYIIDAERQGRV